jgi:hypothetical protein
MLALSLSVRSRDEQTQTAKPLNEVSDAPPSAKPVVVDASQAAAEEVPRGLSAPVAAEGAAELPRGASAPAAAVTPRDVSVVHAPAPQPIAAPVPRAAAAPPASKPAARPKNSAMPAAPRGESLLDPWR